MAIPTNQCPRRIQVHHITQETPDVWTIFLICHDYYPYRAEQYALVSVCNSAETLRVYTTFSMPDVSEHIALTMWRVDGGAGSRRLTRGVKRSDYLWLSDAMGEFTYDDKAEDRFLLLAASCGVTSIMSTRRWLAKNYPQADVQVTYSARMPQDVVLADEWRNYPVALVVEDNATEGFIAGCLTRELLAGVPDLASRTMMTCGPTPHMGRAEQEVKTLDVTRFLKEKFLTPVVEAAISGLKFIKLQPVRKFYVPAGTIPLEALESNNVPVVAVCHAGTCDCCKTKVTSGKYMVGSIVALTDAEIAEGYVLVCLCHPQGDLVLA